MKRDGLTQGKNYSVVVKNMKSETIAVQYLDHRPTSAERGMIRRALISSVKENQKQAVISAIGA